MRKHVKRKRKEATEYTELCSAYRHGSNKVGSYYAISEATSIALSGPVTAPGGQNAFSRTSQQPIIVGTNLLNYSGEDLAGEANKEVQL